MQITVTQEDIDSATANSCTLCPIALAIKRVYNGPVKVGSRYLHFIDRVEKLPTEAIEFIFAFDSDKPVQPFTFTLGD